MRRNYQVTRNRVELHNRLESLLEEAHIKIASLVSDLRGTAHAACPRRRREGSRDAGRPGGFTIAATPDQLRNAFGACADLHPVYRRLVKLTLEELRMIRELRSLGYRVELLPAPSSSRA
jgi:hypothetical protein